MVLNRRSHIHTECAIQIPTARWVSNPTVQTAGSRYGYKFGMGHQMFGADAAGA